MKRNYKPPKYIKINNALTEQEFQRRMNEMMYLTVVDNMRVNENQRVMQQTQQDLLNFNQGFNLGY